MLRWQGGDGGHVLRGSVLCEVAGAVERVRIGVVMQIMLDRIVEGGNDWRSRRVGGLRGGLRVLVVGLLCLWW